MRARFALSAVAVAATAALMLTGCVNNETPASEGSTAPSAPATGGETGPATGGVDEAAVALLPAKIKDSGKLIAGVDATYSPNEYKDDAGNPIGWDVELADAMAAKLGLTIDWKISSFDNIIPSITGGTMDIGVSSFTDNVEREKQVDFVNYYTAGILWAAPAGKTVDPDNACGLTVAVQATTVEDTDELPAKDAKCKAEGKPEIKKLKFDGQDEVTNALVLGRADAMSADSPITEYAVKQTDGKLEIVGKSFDVAPYGIAVNKGSELTKAIQAAMQAIVDDGTYMSILEKWGVTSGAIKEITINAASKG